MSLSIRKKGTKHSTPTPPPPHAIPAALPSRYATANKAFMEVKVFVNSKFKLLLIHKQNSEIFFNRLLQLNIFKVFLSFKLFCFVEGQKITFGYCINATAASASPSPE